jgi:predicted MFS family arabinose efflux permease
MLDLIINKYRVSFSGLSRETWLLSIVMLINRSGYMAIPFMSLYVTQSLHKSAGSAGLIITLFGIGSIVGSSAGGKFTDLFGFRPVQIISSITGGLMFILFSTITHFYTLCALSVIISFFTEAFRPANFTAIAAYASEGATTRSYSLNRLATNLGWTVGVSLGGIIASYNYKLLFIVDGTVSIIAGLCILTLLPNAQVSSKAEEETVPATVVKPWQDRFFVKFLILTTIFNTSFFTMFRIAPLFFKEKWHFDEFVIGLILALNGIVIAAFEMIMISTIEKKRSGIFYIIIGVVLIAFSYVLLTLPLPIHLVLATLAILFFTFGEMFAMPFINTLVISRSNELNRGLYAAGFTLSWALAQVIGPSVGFLIAERCGYNTLWAGISIILFLCAFGYFKLSQIKNQDPVQSNIS